MKHIIALILATAITATASPRYWDSKHNAWIGSIVPMVRAGICIGPSTPEPLLQALGIIPSQDAPTPDGHVRTGWEKMPRIEGGVAYRVPVTITAAAQTAKEQQEQAAQLQAIVDSEAGDAIRTLEAHISYFGVTRPATLKAAKEKIKVWKADKKAQAKVQDQLDGIYNATEMILLFSKLESAGIDETTINSVWTYMQTTGQDVAP